MQFPFQYRDFMLRPEVIADVDEIKRFSDRLVEEQAMIGREKKRTTSEWEENVSKAVNAIEKHQAIVIVAEKEKKIVGLCAIFLYAQKVKHIGGLGIMVDQDVRRMGLGKKLMEIVIALAKKTISQLECIELGVIAENRSALALYEQMGFVSVARIPKRMNHFGVYYDEVIMHLWVKLPEYS
ncbi:MAG: GNAT family N-acetyltransferase [Promethearchaeota archaeon]